MPDVAASSTIQNQPKMYFLYLELIGLFLISPLILALPVAVWIKMTTVFVAVFYCVLVSKKMKLFSQINLIGRQWQKISLLMAIRFILFVFISTVLIWLYMPQALFSVLLGNPWLWISISLFYSILSVYPQEFIYRLFFFKRYQHLVLNGHVFILLNACIFSFAHLFFQNTLVFLLTFVGGVLFALTYKKKQSLLLVSLEHSAYGVWLFTLGLGDMLAFPSA